MLRLEQFHADKAIVEALLEDEAAPGLADAILTRAALLDCDPLAVIVHQTRRDQDVIYRRAAALFGLRFVADITPFIVPFSVQANVDAFAGLASVRGRIAGNDVLFAAPSIRQLASLRGMEQRVIITSPRNLSAAIATVNADRLIEESIQRTIRQYPNCCANTDSRKSYRLGLVLTILAIILAALFAPPPAQYFLLPTLSLVLIIPSLFRLWAAITAEKNVPLAAGELLDDEQLPVYSVLVPLRDEAHMVAQLARALARLDYPALGRKRMLRKLQESRRACEFSASLDRKTSQCRIRRSSIRSTPRPMGFEAISLDLKRNWTRHGQHCPMSWRPSTYSRRPKMAASFQCTITWIVCSSDGRSLATARKRSHRVT